MIRFFLLFFALSACLCGCQELASETEDSLSHSAEIHFLDVGQGLSILLEKGGKFALYDAGPDSAGFWDTLGSRQIPHLDWVLISHFHRDHAGGLLEWNGKIGIDTLFYGTDAEGGPLRDSVFFLAKKFGTAVVKADRGYLLPCSPWVCQILWQPEFSHLNGNNASAALRISDGFYSALFEGDLETQGEAGLLEISDDLQADLLQVGHHGSKTSSSLPFLERVAPKYAVISVGKENPYGHPAKETLRKLEIVLGDSSKVFRTDLQGPILFEWIFGKGLWHR